MHINPHVTGTHSPVASVPHARRVVEDKPSFRPALQEATEKVQPASSREVKDSNKDAEPEHDERQPHSDVEAKSNSSPKRPETPLLSMRPVVPDTAKIETPVNKKAATASETQQIPVNVDSVPVVIRSLRAIPWTPTETIAPSGETPPADPTSAKPLAADAVEEPSEEEASPSGSPGPLVFQLSFQVPNAAPAPEEESHRAVPSEPLPEAAEIKADAGYMDLANYPAPLLAEPLIAPPAPPEQSRVEQPVRPSIKLPVEPAPEPTPGSMVQKLGVLVRGIGDQVVRLQISQSNGSLHVAAHADDEALGKHLNTSLPELVDRLGQHGYTPAVTSTPTSTAAQKDLQNRGDQGSAAGQQSKQQPQRDRGKNAWHALASELHDS